MKITSCKSTIRIFVSSIKIIIKLRTLGSCEGWKLVELTVSHPQQGPVRINRKLKPGTYDVKFGTGTQATFVTGERSLLLPRKPLTTYEINFLASLSKSFLLLKFSFRGSFPASNKIMSFSLASLAPVEV